MRPKLLKLVEAIKNCNRMVQFNIYDLQDITRIANKKFVIENVQVNPRALLNDVVNSYQMHAHKKKQRIILKIDDSVPKCIESDPKRLTQIVNNLLNNAIKFSDEKNRIDIESYYLADIDMFQVTVVDDGITISDEEAVTLFKPYSTLKSARDINAAGPGLGLYMCRHLC
jgi:signal transduction histidine kinase